MSRNVGDHLLPLFARHRGCRAFDLIGLISDFEAKFEGFGVVKGHSVVIVASNSVNYLVTVIALWRLNAYVTVLNPDYKSGEFRDYFSRIRADWIMIDTHLNEAFPSTCGLMYLSDETVYMIKALKVPSTTVVGTSDAICFMTSGTTGPPKSLAITHDNLCNQLDNLACLKLSKAMPSLHSGQICMSVLPFFHAGGLITALLMLSQGITLVIKPRFDKNSFLPTIQSEKVNILPIVPVLIEVMLKHPRLADYCTSVNVIFVGGDKSSVEDLSGLQKRLPTSHVVQLYGSTEAGVLVLMKPTWKSFAFDRVGVALPGVDVEVGEDDELLLKTNMINYESAAIREQCDGDYLRTGDITDIDESGSVAILGRLKFIFKVKGYQVSPYELESSLKSRFPAIRECVVFKKAGDISVIFHSDNADDVSVDAIRTYFEENFVHYKRVKGLIEWASDFERTPSGKVDRRFYNQSG